MTTDPQLLLRALEVYELDRLDFAEAYLVAQAEATGVGEVLSFDQSIDSIESINGAARDLERVSISASLARRIGRSKLN